MRPRLGDEFADSSYAAVSIDEAKVAEELTMMTADMWKSKESNAKSTTWDATGAMNFQSTIQKIMEKLANGDTIPYDAEYLDERKYAAAGFCLLDDCFIYDDSAMSPTAGILKKVKTGRWEARMRNRRSKGGRCTSRKLITITNAL